MVIQVRCRERPLSDRKTVVRLPRSSSYRPWVKGATSTKMNGAAIAMPSSSIGMSIRLNFGWWYDMSLIPLCGARCFVFKSDVVTN